MSIAAAIKGNTKVLSAAQNAYQQSFYFVNQQMVTVSSSSLPALLNPPDNWSDFLTTETEAKVAAQSWFDAVAAKLLGAPTVIASYNATISQLLSMLANEAQALEANPSDAGLLAIFRTNLEALNSQFDLIQLFISGAVTAVKTFDDTALPQATQDLQTLVSDYSDTVQADQAQISKITSDIAALNADIQAQIQDIVTLLIVAGGAATVTRLAPGWTPLTCLVKFLAAVTLSLATYHIVLDGIEIAKDKAEIAADDQSITSDTADVAACQIQVTSFTSLVNQMATVGQDLQTLLLAWQALQGDIGTAIEDINDAVNRMAGGTPDYAAIAADITDATSEWNALYAAAGTMALNISVNTAQLSPGMSQDEIAAATAAATTVDIITFVNGAMAPAAPLAVAA